MSHRRILSSNNSVSNGSDDLLLLARFSSFIWVNESFPLAADIVAAEPKPAAAEKRNGKNNNQ